MKRIVFISFRCTSKSIESSDEEIEEENDINLSHPSWTYSIDFTNNHSNNNNNNNKNSNVDSKSSLAPAKTTPPVNIIPPVHTVIGQVV